MLATLSAWTSRRDVWPYVRLWLARLELAVAAGSLAGVGLLCAIILAKPFFLGADSAHHYAHVWYIADQLFHHGRLPLHIGQLESGRTLTFPYAVVPWMVAAPFEAVFGDWAVTATMVAGFVLYGWAAVWARPALRDPRLLSLLYANTFLIEGLVSFQMAFIWSVALFFMFVALLDRGAWGPAGVAGVAAIYTHPFAGVVAVGGYGLFSLAWRRDAAVPLLATGAVIAIVTVPYAAYLSSATVIEDTRRQDLVGTLEWMARYRGLVVVLPFALSLFAPQARTAYLALFTVMALAFMNRIVHEDVNTFGLDRYSHPFYGPFMTSDAFDPTLNYRVLEPNDREDGAYQLMRGGARLSQDFFDQTQVRRWWNSREQYECFLGAREVDVVLLEKDYPLKFSQNEDVRLGELESAGKARMVYRDPKGRFTAYDVRGARQAGAKMADCGL